MLTLQLMSRLDASACHKFYHPAPTSSVEDGQAAGAQLSTQLGLDALIPDSTIDSFLFKPCGYSLNLLQRDRYATIHVTPEVDWSYASFETNVDFGGRGNPALGELVQRVLEIFQPGRLSITLFVSDDDSRVEGRPNLDALKNLKGWQRRDRILYQFDGYELLYVVRRRML